jgi:hypothetical protein
MRLERHMGRYVKLPGYQDLHVDLCVCLVLRIPSTHWISDKPSCCVHRNYLPPMSCLNLIFGTYHHEIS